MNFMIFLIGGITLAGCSSLSSSSRKPASTPVTNPQNNPEQTPVNPTPEPSVNPIPVDPTPQPCTPATTKLPPTIKDFWEGRAVLGSKTLISFEGAPENTTMGLKTTARPTLIDGADGKIYAYLRLARSELVGKDPVFDMYLATSQDRGLKFEIQPDPVIKRDEVIKLSDQTVNLLQKYYQPGDITRIRDGGATDLQTAYDGDVIHLKDGYYMLFECGVLACTGGVSACLAFSQDGLSNWKTIGVPVCPMYRPDGCTPTSCSGAVPNFLQEENGKLSLQWANVDGDAKLTTHHQAPFGTNLAETITIDPRDGQLPQNSLVGEKGYAWDSKNFGSGDIVAEDGTYYLFYEGANNYGCLAAAPEVTSHWGIGMAKTSTPSDPASWTLSQRNPLIMSNSTNTCWMGYPSIMKIDGRYYLYYFDPFFEWSEAGTKTIYRQEMIWGQ